MTRMFRRHVPAPAGLVLLLLFAPTSLVADDLSAFLAAASAATRPGAIVRADGELINRSPEGASRQQVIIVRRPNGDLYVELSPSGVRAVLASDGSARLVSASGAAPSPLPPQAPLPGSEFSPADLQPFSNARFRAPTVVDRSAEEVTVSCHPTSGPDSLAVLTFDRQRHTLLKALTYRDNLSNLVKLRRESGHVPVAGAWLPTEITVEHFPLRASSSLALRWEAAPDLAALFDQDALAKRSPLRFPDLEAPTPGPVTAPPAAGR
jgi:hypothetical protein